MSAIYQKEMENISFHFKVVHNRSGKSSAIALLTDPTYFDIYQESCPSLLPSWASPRKNEAEEW